MHKCKVFDRNICLNHFSVNPYFKLKRKSRDDYQIIINLSLIKIKYDHMSCKISFAKKYCIHEFNQRIRVILKNTDETTWTVSLP